MVNIYTGSNTLEHFLGGGTKHRIQCSRRTQNMAIGKQERKIKLFYIKFCTYYQLSSFFIVLFKSHSVHRYMFFSSQIVSKLAVTLRFKINDLNWAAREKNKAILYKKL